MISLDAVVEKIVRGLFGIMGPSGWQLKNDSGICGLGNKCVHSVRTASEIGDWGMDVLLSKVSWMGLQAGICCQYSSVLGGGVKWGG